MHLIFQLSEARRRAMEAARAETLSLLAPFGPSLPPGGPFGEIGGVYWVTLDSPTLVLKSRLPLLGYARAAYEMLSVPTEPAETRPPHRSTGDLPGRVRWRGHWYVVRELWRRDEAEEREAAPDRRAVLLPDVGGEPREVRG